MQRDGYGLLVQTLLATAILGSVVRYDKFYLFHAVLGLALLRSLIAATPGTLLWPERLWSRYHYFFVFLLGWFALGLTWSVDRMATVKYLGYLGIGVALMLVVIKYVGASSWRFEHLFRAAVALFLIDIVVGLLEAFTSFRLPTSPLAEGSEMWKTAVFASRDLVAFMQDCPTGFHGNPNNYGVVMVSLLPFFLLHRSMAVRAGGVAVVFLLIYYTSSRGSLVGALFVVTLWPLYTRSAAGRILVMTGYGVAALLVGIGLVGDLTQTGNTRLRDLLSVREAVKQYLSDDPEQRGSGGIRRQLIANGLTALGNTYGIGIGGGGDRLIQAQMGLDADREILAMHNFWVEILVNGGVPLFLPFVLWYAAITWELFRRSHRLARHPTAAYYCGATSLALAGFVPAAISASSVIYMLPFYILLGLAISLINVSRQLAAVDASRLREEASRRSPPLPHIAPLPRPALVPVRR